MVTSATRNRSPKFISGRLLATPGALETFDMGFIYETLQRHISGDWGDMSDEDKQANEDALKHGGRIFSAYIHPQTGEKLWVITEADRSATTSLLPSEY